MARRVFVTNSKGTVYVLQGYVIGEWQLVPFVPHWNGRDSESCDLWKKYWEPHYAEKETWIPISKVNFDDFDITKEEYLAIKYESDKGTDEILKKFHASF